MKIKYEDPKLKLSQKEEKEVSSKMDLILRWYMLGIACGLLLLLIGNWIFG